jgi:Mg-chelatase subunit ChlD
MIMSSRPRSIRRLVGALALTAATLPSLAGAQPALQSYAIKIFRVDPVVYPFVQVYFRTFDQDKQPLLNLNELNVGLMVDGRSYDPMKMQYRLESLRTRKQGIRTVLVLDASQSMKGKPYEAAVRAAGRYIDSKRPQDQVAVLAMRDTSEGYELVSTFERDPAALGRRIADVKPDGKKSRLYDTLAGAMQMASMPTQGGGGEDEYIVSTSIVVLSDGRDQGSALTRDDLNTRITSLSVPVPVYSVAYTQQSTEWFKNLQAISKNSFGSYYEAGQAYERMQQMVESIQNILQSDYVLTFRSSVPVDGKEHNFKLGIEYPSKSGRFTFESSKFEAVEPPPVPALLERVKAIGEIIKAPPGNDPYMTRPDAAAAAPTPAAP